MGDARVFLRVRLGATGEPNIANAVARVDVHDEDRGTDIATVVMEDRGGSATSIIRPGLPIRIEMGWEGEHAVMFLGHVHQVQSFARGGDVGLLQFVCRDMSELLNVEPPSALREHSGTLDAILTSLAQEVGLTKGVVDISPMPSWPDEPGRRLVQGQRRAWAMIQDIARDYQGRAFVEVNSLPGNRDATAEAAAVAQLYFYSERAIVAQAPLGKLTYCHGFGSLIEFQPRTVGSGAMPAGEATVMDPTSGEVRTETGTPPPPATTATMSSATIDQLTATSGPAAARTAEAAFEATSGSIIPRSDAATPVRMSGTPSDPTLAARMIEPDPTRVIGLAATGTAMGSVFLRAKSSVEIEGHSSVTDGRWYLRRVNHIIEQSRTNRRDPATPLEVKSYRTTFEATR